MYCENINLLQISHVDNICNLANNLQITPVTYENNYLTKVETFAPRKV